MHNTKGRQKWTEEGGRGERDDNRENAGRPGKRGGDAIRPGGLETKNPRQAGTTSGEDAGGN